MSRQALTFGGVFLLTACGGGSGAEVTHDNTAGMGIPQQRGYKQYAGERRAIRTRVHVAPNGYFLGSWHHTDVSHRYLIEWPADTEQGPSGTRCGSPTDRSCTTVT